MNGTASKCSKCFALGSNIEQATFTNQADAFGLYRVLIRHGQLPMLCNTGAAVFRVCYPAGTNAAAAATRTAGREAQFS